MASVYEDGYVTVNEATGTALAVTGGYADVAIRGPVVRPAVLGSRQVADLRDALTEWLERIGRPDG